MARGLCALGIGMSRGKWWLWALLGLLAITALMWMTKSTPIERDIQIRTTAALSSQGHDWATVNVKGRDVALGGASPSDETRLNVIDIAEKVYGVRTVEDITTELELRSASYGLNHRGDKVHLSGAMPTQALIDSSVAAASNAYGAENVVNAMTIDAGVRPPEWLDGFNAMIPSLATLRNSTVHVSDDGTNFAGLVETDSAKSQLLSAANSLFGDGVSESITIKPAGPSVEELAAMAAAKAKAERIALDQATAYDAERIATEKAAAEMAKAAADELSAEEAAKAEEAARLAAQKADADAAKIAVAQAKAKQRATFVANCQLQLNSAMEGEAINFASNSANIAVTSYPLLDRIAGLVSNCKGAVREMGASIEITGHTDSTGNADVNMHLSDLRANAVRDYVVTKGAPSDLLNANGYGETNPIVDNATAEGRARNRRIQFDIKQ